MISLGIFGANGRMGRCIQALLPQFADFQLRAGIDHQSASLDAFKDCDVVIDFSLASATEDLLAHLEQSKAALVTGVTGRTEAQTEAICALARQRPVFISSNFSLGIAVLADLSRRAACMLEDFDIEIAELHHKRKADAPSGTALQLAQAITAVAKDREILSSPRWGAGHPRQPQEIGVAALRGGDVTGEHTVYFLGEGERIELTHRATDRGIFAQGALRAARWVKTQSPGVYGMNDLLAHLLKNL